MSGVGCRRSDAGFRTDCYAFKCRWYCRRSGLGLPAILTLVVRRPLKRRQANSLLYGCNRAHDCYGHQPNEVVDECEGLRLVLSPYNGRAQHRHNRELEWANIARRRGYRHAQVRDHDEYDCGHRGHYHD